jgi:hypothetical protein
MASKMAGYGFRVQAVGARSLCALEAQGALPVPRGDSFGDRSQSCSCLEMRLDRLERFERWSRHWRFLFCESAGAACPTGDDAALMALPGWCALQCGSRTNAGWGGGLLKSVGEVRWT